MTDFRKIRAAQRDAGERVVLDALAAKKAGIARPAGPWIMTAGGRAMEYLSPDPAAVALTDIAAHLAKLCRFAGAVGSFYSVAQHSVFVAGILPLDSGDGHPPGLLKAAGLFHDAHEYILGDMPTPMKAAIRKGSEGYQLRAIEAGLDNVIHKAFGLPSRLPEGWHDLIKRADLVALATERRDLMPPPAPGYPDWDIDLPPAAPARIVPLTWDRAEDQFIATARQIADMAWLTGGAWER